MSRFAGGDDLSRITRSKGSDGRGSCLADSGSPAAGRYTGTRPRRFVLIFVVLVAVALLISPLLGGHMRALAELRFRSAWLLLGSVALQAVALYVPGPRDLLHEAAYVGSYAPAGVFLWLNRRVVPGVWVIGLGAGLNLIAIVANGGVMPASRHALAVAGLAQRSAGFSNSTALASPKLLFLGDVFAIPASWPLSNVFSVGDVLIAAGAFLVILRVTRRAPTEATVGGPA